MANFWSELASALTGFAAGGPVGAAAGALGASSQKAPGGQANLNAANQFYNQELQQGQQSYQQLQQILPALMAKAGLSSSGQQMPYNPNNDPNYANAYAEFNAQEQNQLRQAEAAAAGQQGQGNYTRGSGPGYYGYHAAEDTAAFNRNYMAQEQQRQSAAVTQLLQMLSGLSNRSAAGAQGVLGIGNQQAALGRAQNAQAGNDIQGIVAALGNILHKSSGGGAGTYGTYNNDPTNPINNPANYGPPSSGALNYPTPTG